MKRGGGKVLKRGTPYPPPPSQSEREDEGSWTAEGVGGVSPGAREAERVREGEGWGGVGVQCSLRYFILTLSDQKAHTSRCRVRGFQKALHIPSLGATA